MNFQLFSQEIMSINELSPKDNERNMESLSKSFQWLLKLGAGILNQHPLSLYYQVLCIEHQFMDVYMPIELMDNVMLMQQPTGRRKFCGITHRSTQFDSSW
jgi:hypothetical protein